MNEQQSSVSSNSAGKNAAIVGGAVAVVVALVLLASGGALLWVDASKTDKAGYLKLRSGHWSVVVMKADGSPGIAADVAVGAKTPVVVPAAYGFIGGGALVALMAAALLYAGTSGPRPSRVAAPELA